MTAYDDAIAAAEQQGNVQLATELRKQGTPQAQQQRAADFKGSIEAVLHGQQPSDREVQAAFATASAVALAVASGAVDVGAIASGIIAGSTAALTGAAAAIGASSLIMAPIAAAVFAGGEGIGAVIQLALGIHNGTSAVYACTKEDTDKGTDPSDPRWVRVPGDPAYPHGGSSITPESAATHPETVMRDGWLWVEATDGMFERWARPIIVRAIELLANCKPLPGANNLRDWGHGLVAAWNAAAAPGTPMRKIPFTYGDDAGNFGAPALPKGLRYARNRDPVQQLISGMFSGQWPGGVAVSDPDHPPIPREGNPGHDGGDWFLIVAETSSLDMGVRPVGVHLGHLGIANLAHFGREVAAAGGLTAAQRATLAQTSAPTPPWYKRLEMKIVTEGEALLSDVKRLIGL